MPIVYVQHLEAQQTRDQSLLQSHTMPLLHSSRELRAQEFLPCLDPFYPLPLKPLLLFRTRLILRSRRHQLLVPLDFLQIMYSNPQKAA